VAANNLLTNAFSNRITNVKGCLTDPFIHAIYGHMHRNNIVSKCNYKNDMFGFVLGVDNVWTFGDEKYLRLGAALGYVHGKMTPSGILSRTGETPDTTFNVDPNHFITGNNHDSYVVKLFSAYESFSDKCLKTNIGIILGYNHSSDKLHVGDLNTPIPRLTTLKEMSDTKFVSHSIFLGAEFIKNLYAYSGYQFGLWLKANYSHIYQHSNEMMPDYGVKLDYNFLATVVGLNVEKETFKHANKKLTLSLKVGWEFQVIQNFDFVRTVAAFATAAIFNDINKFLRYPTRNATVVLFNASQKLSNHWSIVGSYSSRFNKDSLAHNLSGGIEYSF
jgi:hypothetical protein